MSKLGILIGRFSPLHSGHKELIRYAKANCNKLIILIGSANSARTIKTPFSYIERKADIDRFMIHESITNANILPLNDYTYNNSNWISDVVSVVNQNVDSDDMVTLFGHDKDGNDYLKWFPQYGYCDVSAKHDISSTEIRKTWYVTARHNFAQCVLDDYDYFNNETKLFDGYPFKDTLNFSCSDAIVECVGHILLIQRAKAPGHGTWALPGGFKNNNETFLDCAIRELKEETNLRVPEKVLRGSIVNTQLFDSINRGMGIPRHTLAVHIKIDIDKDGKLPRISPADDAMTARWIPINDVMNNFELFDDHLGIICSMCGTMPISAHFNPRYV